MSYTPHPQAGLLAVMKEMYWIVNHEDVWSAWDFEPPQVIVFRMADDPEAGVLFTRADAQAFWDLFYDLDMEDLDFRDEPRDWHEALERMRREIA